MSTTMTVLITVKAYPAISKTKGENVCVAGILADKGASPAWIRLWPVPFRDLAFQQRFKKYQFIEVEATKSVKDGRPESYAPNVDTIVLGTTLTAAGNWDRRRPYVEPLIGDSMCELQRRQRVDGTSLGAIKPLDIDLEIVPESEEWESQKQSVVDQPSLLLPEKQGLEKVPFRFMYRYRCADPACNGHRQSNVDWEIAQSWRKWRDQYDQPGLIDAMRKKYLDEMFAPSRDSYLFVGNQHVHREAFLVLGVWWPPRQDPSLFS